MDGSERVQVGNRVYSSIVINRNRSSSSSSSSSRDETTDTRERKEQQKRVIRDRGLESGRGIVSIYYRYWETQRKWSFVSPDRVDRRGIMAIKWFDSSMGEYCQSPYHPQLHSRTGMWMMWKGRRAQCINIIIIIIIIIMINIKMMRRRWWIIVIIVGTVLIISDRI